MEHGEYLFPVARRRLLVVHVAVGQRVAMLGAAINRELIIYRAGFQQLGEVMHHRQRRVGIMLGKATVKFTAQFSRQAVRRVGAFGDQSRAVQLRRCDDPFGIGSRGAHDVTSAHAKTDGAHAAVAHVGRAVEESQNRAGVVGNHLVG